MPLSVAGVAVLGLAAGLSLSLAVLLGAALSPTDPVLASDVQVGGPDVEEGGDVPADAAGDDERGAHEERSEVRFALTSEAGLNDGLAFPFVYLALVLAAEGSAMSRLVEWVGFHLVLRVVVGIAVESSSASCSGSWRSGPGPSSPGSPSAALRCSRWPPC